jgi:hypothetical protein
MVALIIFFPAIVSGGLDKAEKVDIEKVQQEMNRDIQLEEQQEKQIDQLRAPAPAGAASGVESLAPPPAASSEDEDQKKLDELFKPKGK